MVHKTYFHCCIVSAHGLMYICKVLLSHFYIASYDKWYCIAKKTVMTTTCFSSVKWNQIGSTYLSMCPRMDTGIVPQLRWPNNILSSNEDENIPNFEQIILFMSYICWKCTLCTRYVDERMMFATLYFKTAKAHVGSWYALQLVIN